MTNSVPQPGLGYRHLPSHFAVSIAMERDNGFVFTREVPGDRSYDESRIDETAATRAASQ
jgi:hypothetical protein